MITTESLLAALDQKETTKRKNNTFEFIQFLEFTESDKSIPFYVIYWLYKKWCRQSGIRKHKVVTKHALSKTIGLFFKKKSSYPKSKRFGVTINYEMRVFTASPYLPLSKEEEELAFKYYNFQYKQDRKKRSNVKNK